MKTFMPLMGALLIVGCSPSPSYRSFIDRDEHYYNEVADGCEKLTSLGLSKQTLAGNDPRIAKVLRGIHSEFIDVDTNRIFIMVGKGRGGYGIIWEQAEDNPDLWTLSTTGENLTKVLLSKKLPAKRSGT